MILTLKGTEVWVQNTGSHPQQVVVTVTVSWETPSPALLLWHSASDPVPKKAALYLLLASPALSSGKEVKVSSVSRV